MKCTKYRLLCDFIVNYLLSNDQIGVKTIERKVEVCKCESDMAFLLATAMMSKPFK